MSSKALMILQSPWPLLGAWVIGGLVTVIVPLSKWKKDKNQYYSYAGQYIEYENNQRAYEEAQNGDDNNNNNQNQYWDCKWYQFKCRQNRYYYQYANEDGGDGNQQRLPDWYASLGGTYEEERREREDMQDADEAPGALKFVYTCMMLMFVGILLWGGFVIVKKRQPMTLLSTMAVFGFCSLMQVLLLPQGVIQTEDRALEDSIYGWYGQLSVLMVYSSWGYFLFSLIAGAVFGIKAFLEYKLLGAERNKGEAAISSKELGEEPAPVDETTEYKSMA